MVNATVQLTFRQVIDDSSTGSFERNMLELSFNEFAIKCQEYNIGSKFFSLKEMIANNPKANSLHYKTALAIGGLIDNLNKKIPYMTDSFGRESIPFETHAFEIIESNPFNRALHAIAVSYTTPYLTLIDIVGEYFLLTSIREGDDKVQQPFMVKMRDGLGITSYEKG